MKVVSYTATPHTRIHPIKECYCNHPKCNGLYLVTFPEQEHCLHWYWSKIDKHCTIEV